MKVSFPDPKQIFPLPIFDRVCFIKNTVKNPNIEIGEYTYFDDPDDSKNFERNVLYHYDFIGDKLKIGKFCALATNVKFIMNGANHRTDIISTFPFPLFGEDWAKKLKDKPLGAPSKGDTVVGNDVWIGYGVTIMPGVQIGDGAIIASESVVVADVPPFCIYGGNPAKLIKKRFEDEVIDTLLEISWWNWSFEDITKNIDLIFENNIEALRGAYEKISKK